jgi:hypothetical protein
MAGQPFAPGWQAYTRWITLIWKGRVEDVIAALRGQLSELGEPPADDKEGSPRRVVSATLNYLENHRQKMRYDHYRRQGLPMTSSHIESTVKLFNRRVKGTEKFWSEAGAEAILQLRADYLSETDPIETFWKQRETNASGRRRYRRTG